MGELIDLEERREQRREWLVVREKCRACHFTAMGVVWRECDLDAQECGRCHRFTSVVTHFLKDQGDDALAEHRRLAFPLEDEPVPEWIPRLESVK